MEMGYFSHLPLHVSNDTLVIHNFLRRGPQAVTGTKLYVGCSPCVWSTQFLLPWIRIKTLMKNQFLGVFILWQRPLWSPCILRLDLGKVKKETGSLWVGSSGSRRLTSTGAYREKHRAVLNAEAETSLGISENAWQGTAYCLESAKEKAGGPRAAPISGCGTYLSPDLEFLRELYCPSSLQLTPHMRHSGRTDSLLSHQLKPSQAVGILWILFYY